CEGWHLCGGTYAVMAQGKPEGIPFTFDCSATEGVEIEEDFCDLLLLGMLRTDLVRTAKPGDNGSLNMIVLPLQDESNPDKMATSITMSVSLPRDADEHILAYQWMHILNKNEVHDDEVLDRIVSQCLDGVFAWVKKAVGSSPQDELAAQLAGSDI
ncbi:MAG: hypothetical protein OQK55_10570, partial [Thermoanaerobaculales bacterium]|nr:hypothetical protein [Thermoanaerobaculales bacterium]